MSKSAIRITLFYCSNSINPAELLNTVDLNQELTIKPISLACSGRVNIQYLLKAMEKGADGVILLTCPNDTCNYVEGNLRAGKRVMAVNSILKESGYEHDRIMLIQPEFNESSLQIVKRIKNACEDIKTISQPGKITV